MNAVKASPQIQDIVQEIDRLIAEMNALRSHVSSLSSPPVQPGGSVREAEYFGMWAGREDIGNLSSREWLNNLRSQQWARL
jgi:hypothetical protein